MAHWKTHKKRAFKYLKWANNAAAAGHRLAAAMWRRKAAREATKANALRKSAK